MTTPSFDTKTLALLVTTLLLAAAGVTWLYRRRLSDHDVSDPGITL
jgi:hypothetical protein